MSNALLAAGLVVIVLVSGWLSLIDIREHRLPNRIVGPLAAGVTIWLLLLGIVNGELDRTVSALGWGLAGFAVFLVLNLTAGLGMGDVKYAMPVCATLGWFGWDSLRYAIFGLAISGAVAALISMSQGNGKNHRLAYGPFMAFGLVCGIVRGLWFG